MTKEEGNTFLNNKCMKVIMELIDNNPNDMELGKAVREFIIKNRSYEDPNQIELIFPDNL